MDKLQSYSKLPLDKQAKLKEKLMLFGQQHDFNERPTMIPMNKKFQ